MIVSMFVVTTVHLLYAHFIRCTATHCVCGTPSAHVTRPDRCTLTNVTLQSDFKVNT
jgi:hypothetical protein